MQLRSFPGICLLAVLLLLPVCTNHVAAAQGKAAPATGSAQKSPAAGLFLIVPVRVHLLRSTVTPAAGTKLTFEDVRRIFKKANGIWHQAGIHLYLQSIVSEDARPATGFEHATVMPYNILLSLRPEGSKQAGMFHVYYLGEIPPNGVFMQTDGIFVKEAASLMPVEGGIDEPLPRVTAHELGHGMGLPHRQNVTNLMASGTTGTSLNAEEASLVHRTLEKLPWVQTPAQFLEDADRLMAAGKKPEAQAHYRTILELPVDVSIKKLARDKAGKK